MLILIFPIWKYSPCPTLLSFLNLALIHGSAKSHPWSPYSKVISALESPQHLCHLPPFTLYYRYSHTCLLYKTRAPYSQNLSEIHLCSPHPSIQHQAPHFVQCTSFGVRTQPFLCASEEAACLGSICRTHWLSSLIQVRPSKISFLCTDLSCSKQEWK